MILNPTRLLSVNVQEILWIIIQWTVFAIWPFNQQGTFLGFAWSRHRSFHYHNGICKGSGVHTRRPWIQKVFIRWLDWWKIDQRARATLLCLSIEERPHSCMLFTYSPTKHWQHRITNLPTSRHEHLTIWRVIIVCGTTTYSTTKSGIVDGRKRYEALSQRTLGIKWWSDPTEHKVWSHEWSGCMKIMTKLWWGHGKTTKINRQGDFDGTTLFLVCIVSSDFKMSSMLCGRRTRSNMSDCCVSQPQKEVFLPHQQTCFNVLDHPYSHTSTWPATQSRIHLSLPPISAIDGSLSVLGGDKLFSSFIKKNGGLLSRLGPY